MRTRTGTILDRINMRLFVLERNEDHSGISGTGVVAEGVEYSNGMVALLWKKAASVSIFRCIKDVETIHGHHGATVIRWLDV